MARSDEGGSGAGFSIFVLILGLLMIAGAAGAYLLAPRFLGDGGSDAPPVTLSTPAELAGLTLSQDPQLQQQVDGMKTGMAAEAPEGATTVAAAYTDSAAAAKFALVAAADVGSDTPDEELAAIFASQAAADIKLDAPVDVDGAAGDGGAAQCAPGTAQTVPLILCVWVDPNSLGMAIFFNREAADAATLFPQIKSGMVTTGS